MSGRVGNQLPNNLPQLQNCIKRDAESYIDEFRLQQQRFQAVMDVVRMDPSSGNKDFEDLVMFMGHVCFYVSDETQSFAGDVTKLLKEYGPALNPGVRLAACKALILIRNRGLLGATDLLTLFFELLRCQDKSLRTFLRNHIITDIKNMNKKHKDVKINSQIQKFMKSMLDDSNAVASKISLEIMIELYKKNVWQDEKTVNYIAGACFSKTIKIMVTAISFFLGRDEDEKDDDDDSDDEKDKDKDKKQPPTKSISDVMMANKFNKKSNKRKNKLERLKKAAKKETSKEKKDKINFSALSLIWNPQKMGEDLLKMLQGMNERFEVKLMVMNLISRLIAVCDVYLENFYPYLQRYLQPHQREVTKILVYAAQSCNERIPPNYIEPVLLTVVNNFISERNSNECITVGLNTVREICSRCPLVMNEDLLQDLALYQKFKDKNVAMGAKSLVQLFRGINPALLQRKDRGRPTEATIELKPKEYGELDAKDYIPGAEVLVKNILKNSEDEDDDDEDEEEDTDYDTNNETLEQASDDEDNDGEEYDSDDYEEEDDDGEDDWEEASEEEEEEITDKRNQKKETKEKVFVSRSEENKERLKKIQDEAALVSSTRLLTDEEFKMIRKNQQRKHSEAIHRKKRKHEDSDEEDESDSDDEESQRKELVSLSSIERLYKKSRSDKAGRLATTMEGREGREQYVWKRKKNPFSSTKQKEKNRNKAFTMVKHKLRGKKKKSFHEKQAQLKKSLIKQMKVMK